MYLTFLDNTVMSDTPTPAQCRIISVLDAYARKSGKIVTVTCVEEGHSLNDPHTLRKSFDVRTRDRTPDEIVDMYTFIKANLGNAWTVLYEAPGMPSNPLLKAIWYPYSSPTGPHIHIQPIKGTNYPSNIDH